MRNMFICEDSDRLFDRMRYDILKVWVGSLSPYVQIDAGLLGAFNRWARRRYFKLRTESLVEFENRIRKHLRVHWSESVKGYTIDKMRDY